jgi:hypothetical protein
MDWARGVGGLQPAYHSMELAVARYVVGEQDHASGFAGADSLQQGARRRQPPVCVDDALAGELSGREPAHERAGVVLAPCRTLCRFGAAVSDNARWDRRAIRGATPAHPERSCSDGCCGKHERCPGERS